MDRLPSVEAVIRRRWFTRIGDALDYDAALDSARVGAARWLFTLTIFAASDADDELSYYQDHTA